jgi:hypothetical protein
MDAALSLCSARAVLPSTWEEFAFPQEERQGGPYASSDRSYVPQGHQEPHLIEQSELTDLVRDLILSKQQAQLLGSRVPQWNKNVTTEEEARKTLWVLYNERDSAVT